MILQFGFSYPNYLANFTIGFGGRTLWFTIILTNWKSIGYQKKNGAFQDFGACFSIFTVAYTNANV